MSAQPEPESANPDPEKEARLRRAASGGPRGGPKSSGVSYALLLAGGLIGSVLFSLPGRGPGPGTAQVPPVQTPSSPNIGELSAPGGPGTLSAPRSVAPPRTAPTPENSDPALGGLDLESARNPFPESSPDPTPSRPRLERTESLAPIQSEAGVTSGGLRVSGVDNKDFIEAVPMSAGEAKGAQLVKPAQPKCRLRVRQIPPCAWKVERRGGYCINERGVVTTQEGVTSVEIPATKNGVIVPYLKGGDHSACDPIVEAPETPR